MRRAPIAIALSIILVLLVTGPASGTTWTINLIDNFGNSDSPTTSLQISPTGTPYVSWWSMGGTELWWAKWTGSSWNKTAVIGSSFIDCYDTQSDYGPAAGFTSGGKPRIASACIAGGGTAAKVLWTYHSRRKGWVTQKIGNAPSNPLTDNRVTNLDLAFDPNTGSPVVAVGDVGTASVTLFVNVAGTTWTKKVVVPGPGGGGANGPVVSIAFDPTDGNLAIAYDTKEFWGGTLTYLKLDSSNAVVSSKVISSGDVIGAPSLAFAPDGTPWIAFDQGTTSASHLEVGSISGSTWNGTSVDSSVAVTGYSPFLAFLGSLPRVAYHDQTDGNLRWAAFDGATWTLSTIASTGDVGEYPSVAFTSGGTPWISFYDRSATALRSAH